MTLQLLHSKFPYTVYEENLIFLSVQYETAKLFQCFLDLGEFFNCCVSLLTLIMPFHVITGIAKCSTCTVI
jgi:hypothetical protein